MPQEASLSNPLVSKYIHQIVKAFDKQAFHGIKYMQTFFTAAEYLQLRKLQQATGCILSGEPIDRFFRRLPSAGELMIIVKFGSHGGLSNWLHRIGYKEEPIKINEIHKTNPDGDGVGIVTRCWRYARESNIIHVIGAREIAMEVILNFCFTSFMNFWTETMAYALYPVASFDESVGIRNKSSENMDLIDNVPREQPTILLDEPAASAVINIHSPFAGGYFRFVGDNKCWVQPLIFRENRKQLTKFINIHSWDNKIASKCTSVTYKVVQLSTAKKACISKYEVPVLTSDSEISRDWRKHRSTLGRLRRAEHGYPMRRDSEAWSLTSSIFCKPSKVATRIDGGIATMLMQLFKHVLLEYDNVKIVEHEIIRSAGFIRAVIHITPATSDFVKIYDCNEVLNALIKQRINVRFTW
ncbi:hypothetical protein GYMLUDRAFT_52642 [Collybiopsis luxurians FD-317 M1]|nr:hypothetical protein GYMLUDRAFT_52642 [Collybiopsis luxurians FD-317 M1]